MPSKEAIETLQVFKNFRESNGYSATLQNVADILGISSVAVFKRVRELRRCNLIAMVAKRSFQIKDEIPYSKRQHEIMLELVANPNETQSVIAVKLGIKPPSLFEQLTRLAEFGAIKFENGTITILDKTLG